MGVLDDFEQGALIGAGGFADVYRAIHVPSRNAVALKVARQDDESRARIRREIEVQRKLAHANVLRIVDWDRESFAWFVTEIAEGNLGEVHDRKPLSERDVVRLLEEVLAGLGCAHRRGFVHRDLSPGNILRARGQWVLADWGYVTDPNASNVGRLTRTGTGGGTFTWAAPETLADAHRVDARSDLYALGKLAAWLLTGKTPSIGAAPDLPDADHWRTYLTRLTATDPIERFESAEAALMALAPVIASIADLPSAESASSSPDPAQDVGTASTSALKRYLVSSEHRIRLFDLVTKVTDDTIKGVADERFGPNRLDQGEALIARIEAYFEVCRPLMQLLFVGCHFGEPVHEELWIKSVQRVADTYQRTGGITRMLDLRRVPGLLAMNAAAFGAVLGERFDNLAAVTTRAVYRRDSQDDVPVLARFSTDRVLEHDMLRTTKRFEQRKTPGSELMFGFLRELGRSVLVSDVEYVEAFDRFEIILALLTLDAGGWATGSFAWRNEMMGENREHGPIVRVRKEFEARGAKWGPLTAGLFGSDPERVKTNFERLTKIADDVAWK